MSEEKVFSGVDALIDRMELYPEEFFEGGEKRGRWAFMYKEYFRDAMTESEKGRIHEAVRKMRRLEFDATVLKELMKEESQEADREMDLAEFGKKHLGHSNNTNAYYNPAQQNRGGKV